MEIKKCNQWSNGDYEMTINTKDLGLPIEYQKLPQFFDSHNIGEDTDEKNAVIERLLRDQGVKTVYDMTCGTGSQVFYLAEQGFDVRGSDLCADLIDQAKEKAHQLNLNVTLEVDDIRTAQKGQFDAVISIFSAIGHLSRSDFEVALKNIRRNLNEGGVYVFDIFNLQSLTDEVISTFVMDVQNEVDGIQFRNQQTSEVDREHGLLISHDHYSVDDGGNKKEHMNTFSLQIYTFDEMKALLANNGFDIVNVHDMSGNEFYPETSLNMLIVARKIT